MLFTPKLILSRMVAVALLNFYIRSPQLKSHELSTGVAQVLPAAVGVCMAALDPATAGAPTQRGTRKCRELCGVAPDGRAAGQLS